MCAGAGTSLQIICELFRPFRKISQTVIRISIVIPLPLFVLGFGGLSRTIYPVLLCHLALVLDLEMYLKMFLTSPAVAMLKTD